MAESPPTFLERLDDAINPIVVKELRQAVQSRFVVAVLLIFLVLQLGWIGIQLLVIGFQGRLESIEFQGGREVFTALQVILLGTCMIFLPMYTAMRLAAERDEANTDLLFITTIPPRAIISGKLISAMILAILIFSACMPFMALTYYLRGIDWPSIFFILGVDFVVVIASVQLMVFFAVLPANRVIRSFLGLIGFGLLVWIFAITMTGTMAMLWAGLTSEMLRGDFWIAVALGALAVVGFMGLFFVWSVAVLQAPSSNRSLPVRLYTLALGAVTGVAAAGASVVVENYAPFIFWTYSMIGLAVLYLVIAVNERRDWSPRVARTIPRHFLGRALAFPFYSGAAGGILFAILLLGLTALGYGIARECFPALARGPLRERDLLDQGFLGMALLFLYVYAYALTAVFVQSRASRRLDPGLTWIILLLLVAAGSMLPYLLSFLLFMDRWRYETHYYWLLANPFAAMVEVVGTSPHRGSVYTDSYLFFAAGWAGLVTLANFGWFRAQVAAFRRREERPSAMPASTAMSATRETPA